MAIKDAELTATLAAPPIPEAYRYRFTRQEFHALGEAGILAEDRRYELIQGIIVEMPSPNPPHASTVKRLNATFSARLVNRAVVGIQDPFGIEDVSEPQPDVLICRFREDFYSKEHPGPGDLLLAVEVSDSTLRYDQDVKMPLYSASGVSEAWIVNLKNRVLEVYRQPGPRGYRSITRHFAGDSVSPLAFPDLSLAVADILPPTEEK